MNQEYALIEAATRRWQHRNLSRCLAIMICLLSLLSFVRGQHVDLHRWSENEQCGFSTKAKGPSNQLECSGRWIDGRYFRYLSHNGILFAVTFTNTEDFLIANVYVYNDRDVDYTVDPRYWAAMQYKSIDIFSKGQNAYAVEHTLPPDKVASKINKGVNWRNALTGIAGRLATNTSTVGVQGQAVDAYGNRVTVIGSGTATSPDLAARERAAATIAERSARASAAATNIESAVLRTNTLGPKQKISGMIYFKRNSKGDFTDVIFAQGDDAYSFPVIESKK